MSLPPDSDSPSEYDSNRPLQVSRSVSTHMKNVETKIQMAHTLAALDAIKRDIIRSDLGVHAQVREMLKAAANKRAVEIGFKDSRGASWWN